MDNSVQSSLDFEEEWQAFDDKEESLSSQDKEIEEETEFPPALNLNIIHLHDDANLIFSETSLSQALVFYNFRIEEKGFFTILDHENNSAFSIINGKNPGTFNDNISSDDIALVLDPTGHTNPVEAFELFIEVSQSLQDTFQCKILDEDRNLMTNQMIEHMKYQFHEHQRQFLASAS